MASNECINWVNQQCELNHLNVFNQSFFLINNFHLRIMHKYTLCLLEINSVGLIFFQDYEIFVKPKLLGHINKFNKLAFKRSSCLKLLFCHITLVNIH